VLKKDDKEVDRWIVSDKPLTIGRTSDNDIVIDSPSVSRRHAVVERDGDGYVIKDSGSVNGMTINGNDANSTTLKDGDIIAIGGHRLFIRLPAHSTLEEVPAFDSTIRAPGNTMNGSIDNPAHVVVTAGQREETFALNRTIIIIGRDVAADIQIEGNFIADYHVEIAHEDGFYTIRHLEGRRKVIVNGHTIKEYILIDGDEICIGDTTLVFKEPASIGSPQTPE